MKVLAVASLPPPPAGQSMATVALVAALRERGVEHRVVDLSRPFAVSRPRLQRLRRAARVARLPLEVLDAARALGDPLVFYLQLGQSRAALARDLPLLALARARRWPVVVHVHGGRFREAFDAAPTWLSAPIGRLLKDVARAVVLSPSLAPMFGGLVGADRVVCVANGTAPEIADRARALSVRPAPTGGLRALFLSNLIDSKGYATVLQAARLSRDRGLSHRFVIAGARTEYGSVDPAGFIDRHHLDNAEYLGVVTGADKLACLEAADALVLPIANSTEGQPIALLEAMQLGLPVITTRRGGIADVVTPECGALIEPGDPAAIVEALERLREPGRWRQISHHNRALGLERYTHERHGARMIAVLEAALG